MTMDNLLRFLQQILTMVDPMNPSSVALGQATLNSMYELVQASGKADNIVVYAMHGAVHGFNFLVECREDFIGVPGQVKENQNKRQRLRMTLMPSC